MSETRIPLLEVCHGRLFSRRCAEHAKDKGVNGSGFCEKCYYPGIEEIYQRYRDLKEEGYTTYQAQLMAGMIDPDA